MATPLTRLAAVVLLASAALLFSAAGPQAQQPSLDDCMDGLKDNLRTLAGSVSAPETRGQALDALRQMQVYTLAAKRLTPHTADEKAEGEEREAFITAFQVDMAHLMQQLLVMEIDLLEGRAEAVGAAIQKDLLKLRDAGHDKYQ